MWLQNTGLQDMWFQKPVTTVCAHIHDLHHMLMLVCGAVFMLVVGLLIFLVSSFHARKHPIAQQKGHQIWIEILWTIIPFIIVLFLIAPTIKVMAYIEHTPETSLTVKIVGHQWYWAYDYIDEKVSFDSNMVEDAELSDRNLRLMEVNEPLVLPEKTYVKLLITSDDVIHSFAVPSFGLKRDAIPGKINETWLYLEHRGIYYGQCSELCGTRHGFMPIAVKVISGKEFQSWLKQKQPPQVPTPQVPLLPQQSISQITPQSALTQ